MPTRDKIDSPSGDYHDRKKVVVLLGSPRKKKTYHLVAALEKELLCHEIETHIIYAYKLEIDYCKGCLRCTKSKKCPLSDQQDEVMETLAGADGIVIASPVYMENISAKLKNIVDRAIRWYHQPELVGVPFLAIATTGATGLNPTLDYLEKVAIGWGMHPTGRIGRSGRNAHRELKFEEARSFIEHLRKPRQNYKISIDQLMAYQLQRIMAKKVSPIDRQYWESNGWSKSIYFFPCRISVEKRLIAAAYFRFLDTVVPTLA